MNPIEAGLLDEICANPADWMPRLVLADWLEEHRADDPTAQARARFIRAQCQAEDGDLAAEIKAGHLLDEYRAAWTEGLPARIEGRFRGGFIEGVRADAVTLLRHWERLARTFPIREVRLTRARGFLSGLLALSLPGRVEGLDLTDNFPDDRSETGWLADLAAGPAFPCLRRLVLDGTWFPQFHLVPALARACMPALESLSLVGVRFPYVEAQQFAGSDLPGRLRDLAVTAFHEGPDLMPLEGFFTAAWSDLRSLAVTNGPGRPEVLTAAVTALAQAPWLARLRSLRLSGPAELGSLLRSPFLEGRLADLALDGGWIEPDDTAPDDRAGLAALPWLAGLRSLDLAGVYSPVLIQALAQAPTPPRLERLSVERVETGPAVEPLLRVIEATGPRDLRLIDRAGDGQWLQRLAASPALASVRRLGLGGGRHWGGVAQALLESTHLGGLLLLDLRGNVSLEPLWIARLRERFPCLEA